MDHVLFPRFWTEEPALWFAQIESVFALNNIRSDMDKYDYVLCELPSTIISLIKDIILDTSREYDDGKYERIKNVVIKRISITDLENAEIGSMKPSDFLKYLKMKADPRVTEETIRKVWMKKLPLHISCIISELKGDLESLCKLADTVKEYITKPCQDKLENKCNVASDHDVSRSIENLGTQLQFIETELLKFNLLYTENNTQLERIQSELHKFKVAYDENNKRLANIQSDLKKIKFTYCWENNNNKTLCKICEKYKSTNNCEGLCDGHQSTTNESNCTNCKDDETNNSF